MGEVGAFVCCLFVFKKYCRMGIDVRQFDVRMSSLSLLIKPKFFNIFMRIKYCHLDLSI